MPSHARVGPGEVDELEDAERRAPPWRGRHGLRDARAALVEHDHLAGLDVADERGADDVERAGLGGEHRGAVEVAQHQRADAVGVAEARSRWSPSVTTAEKAPSMRPIASRDGLGERARGCSQMSAAMTSVSDVVSSRTPRSAQLGRAARRCW